MPVISARQVVLPARVVDGAALEIDDQGRVVEVRDHGGPYDHHSLVPGLIDLQVNGHDDIDVAAARDQDWERLDQLLLAQGVTAWCPTLVTGALEAYAAPLARMATAMARASLAPEILGVHLEGPFLGDRPGAHRQDLLRSVDRDWLDGLPGQVAIVTVAPECRGADEAWDWAQRRGAVASVGHTGASAAAAVVAFDAGARMVTHLFNAMSGLDHRDPGVAAAALLDDRITAGLIADGAHVHPDLIRLAFRAKGPSRICLVTDAVAWRRGSAGSLELHFDGVVPRLADGTIAGSALTMDQAMVNVIAWGATDLVGAVRAASTTPADLIGRPDLGRLLPGARADVAALDAEGRCVATWLAGVPAA